VRFLVRRSIQSVFVVLGVTVIVFVLIHLLPGGPRAMLPARATPAQTRFFIDENGYNHPLIVQYVKYLDNLIHGNLGFSYHYNQTVDSILGQDLPKSVLLVGLSLLVALLVAIPLGIFQAVRRNTIEDYVLTAGAFVGYSMPTFWLGTLLILAFSVSLHIFPSEGPQGATVGAIVGQPLALVLPVATLAIVSIAQFSRFMRSSAMETLVQDYVRLARAKGASTSWVLTRHVFQNSLIPVITLIGLSLPGVIAGAILTESIFNYPGMGLLFWTAATTHDYPVLMGVTIVVGVATVLGNLLADVLYTIADPRVHNQ
jgi:peptide/nickel transport system permease protein